MNTPHLLLWLEGPMQSWGVNAKFNRRTTQGFPSRSALLGLLCAALGAGGVQKELLARFVPLAQTIIAYAPDGQKGAAALQLRDFHMVGSGYDAKDSWQYLHIPKTRDQKTAKGGGTKLTYRYYLQDAAFAVALAVPPDLRQELEAAFISPCWDISLGRKCCVPTEFIFQGIHASADAALQCAQRLAETKKRRELFRVLDGEHEGEQYTLSDVPLQFGPNKRYSERLVTVVCA